MNFIGAFKQRAYLFWLALPLLLYLIPVLLGFAWNSVPGPNIVQSLESYEGRLPNLPITVDAWGTGKDLVPAYEMLKNYLNNRELPLWDPYQALGEPFGVHDQSGSYFPFALLRVLLPYALFNYITIGVYYLAAIFLYWFLRGLELSEKAAIFGGVAYVMSGALSMYIAREHMADQLCMVPVLFWAAALAMRKRKRLWYAVFSAICALDVMAGHIQIAMLSGVLVSVFCLFYGYIINSNKRDYVRDVLIIISAFILGIGLAACYLLPVAEAIRVCFNKNNWTLISNSIPLTNFIAFFFPFISGQPLFPYWQFADTKVAWGDLFAFAGTSLLLISTFGYSIVKWNNQKHRNLFLFFSLGALFLLIRYMSASLIPFDIVDLLPILGTQTRKHSNGLTVFFIIVAASFSVEYVKQWKIKRIRWLALGIYSYFLILFLRLTGIQIISGSNEILHSFFYWNYLFVTIFIAVAILGVLKLAVNWKNLSQDDLPLLLTAVVLGELTLYIPLGNNYLWFFCARLSIATAIVFSGLLLVLNKKVLASGLFVITLTLYALLIAIPSTGLPQQFETGKPLPFMIWLKQAVGDNYRVFGITPRYSSVAEIQDIGAAQAFTPREYYAFVKLIGDREALKNFNASQHLMLSNTGWLAPKGYSLEQYKKVKDIFDWFSVRYLVLDKNFFGRGDRQDHLSLLSDRVNFRVVYQDNSVTIVESLAAKTKAFFSPAISVYPSQAEILKQLKQEPKSIGDAPMVEIADVPNAKLGEATGEGVTIPLDLEVYRPNRVQITFDAPQSGIVVLKDVVFPGWQAKLNGKPTKIIRVNGIVRGVLIPTAGHYSVEFLYRPDSFLSGIRLTSLVAVFLIAIVVEGAIGKHYDVPRWGLFIGGFLVIVVVWTILTNYAGRPGISQQERLWDTKGLTAFYSPDKEVVTTQTYSTISDLFLTHISKPIEVLQVKMRDKERQLVPGEMVLTTNAGTLWRLEPDASLTKLTGVEGEKIRLVNVGMCEQGSPVVEGLDAVYNQGNWVIDMTPAQLKYPNSQFCQL